MNLSKLILLLITIKAYALDGHCLSHAQCQNIVEESTACFLVQESPIEGDETSCSVKCYDIQVGSYCEFEKGQSYGTCKDENYKNPSVNIDQDKCEHAIPNKIMEDLYGA